MTHFATADDDPEFMREQLARFLAWGRSDAPRHAANSAAALGEPAARLDMIRCGIAIYGMDPFHHDPADHGLEPALELVSYVAEVKRARKGESRGLRAAVHRRAGHVDRHDPDRLRRRLPARAHRTTFEVVVGERRVHGRRDGLDGQHHGRPRRRAGRARHGGGADRPRHPRRGPRARAWARSTTR